MNNITKTKQSLQEAKKPNPKILLKKTLESSDFGFTEKGGNGRVKSKGKNLVVYDSFFYGEREALKRLVKNWSPGGHHYEYFTEEYNLKIKIVKSGSEFQSKMFKGDGAVWVELEVS